MCWNTIKEMDWKTGETNKKINKKNHTNKPYESQKTESLQK